MIPGCILAGGQGRRLGGKGKAFINLSGKPLINHSIDNMQKQVSELYVTTRVINKCIPKQDGESKAMFG